MKPHRTKKQQSHTKNRFVRSIAPGVMGVLALALLPWSAHAQGSRGGGGAMAGRGGVSAPSYSAPSNSQPSYSAPSYSRPSYSGPSNSTPSYSRPSYSGPSYSAPTYSRPNYSPSTRTGGDFGSVFGRSQPSYDYNSLRTGGYRYQQGGGQTGQAQGGRTPAQGPAQNGPGAGRTQGQGSVQNGQGTGTGRTPGQGNQIRQTPIYNYQPPSNAITQTNGRTINKIVTYNNGNNGYNRFSNSAEARRYRYGVPHGNRYYYGDYGFGGYFNGGLAFYPFYSPFFSVGYTVLSPYAFYDGAFPSYINYGGVYFAPPSYVYVPYPVYQNGYYNGYRGDDVDGYYLNQNPNYGDGGQYRVGENRQPVPKPEIKDAALDSTLNDIKEAWKTGKIDSLAKHVRRDAKVAVYLRGKYQYSLDSGDYLDMTRDALSATKTVRFELDNAQRKQKGVYTLTGRHVYQDKDGKEHMVYISYVLEQADNDYIITQVGSAPDKVEE